MDHYIAVHGASVPIQHPLSKWQHEQARNACRIFGLIGVRRILGADGDGHDNESIYGVGTVAGVGTVCSEGSSSAWIGGGGDDCEDDRLRVNYIG